MKAKKNGQRGIWTLPLLCCALTTILFNNCTKGFQTVEITASQLSSSSLTQSPPITTPPGDGGAPSPVPIQPILTTSNPTWMAGKSLNEWIEIPKTSGAGGAAVQAFSGMSIREATSELIIGAAGGHNDSSDNRVVSLVLETNTPAWNLRIGPSQVAVRDVSHYPDGSPSARHTYQHNYYVESLHRLFLVGARYVFSGAGYEYRDVDAFSFETNQWDPPGTWAPLPMGSAYGAVKIPGTDDIYTSTLHKWSAAEATAVYKAGNASLTSVWSTPITVRTDTMIRWPLAYDKARNQLFTLQYGDGQSYNGPTVYSSRIDLATGVQTKITIKPGSILDLFVSEQPAYAAMDYDVINDRFLFYGGYGPAVGRVYVIKPSSMSNEWEMSLLVTIPGSPMPPASPGAGTNSNFKYVPRLKGFVLLPNVNSNLFFIKTAQ